jgi:hypothetical protein
MDRLRSLLLARTTTVVLDPDQIANAATRPSRDVDVEKFEDELAQLGFVMSLDLAMTVRRLPFQASLDLKTWILSTLATTVGAHRPHVPLFRGFPAATPANTQALYLRRVLSWLFTRPEQPCPWCGQIKSVGALDPCGHLVCRTCWDGGNYAGCPICHRRVAVPDPFVRPAKDAVSDRVGNADQLRIVNLAFDPIAVARDRFERLLTRATPLSKQDREEIETVIDVMGPKAVTWISSKITVKETLAIVLARFWIAAPDRTAMVRATHSHLKTATDVLRIAAVLMGADPALVEPMRLTSIPRSLRRAVLLALDKLPSEQVLEDMQRRTGLWKRVGERLHPFERADKLPNAALAFAAIRGSDLSKLPAEIEKRATGIAAVAVITKHARKQLRVTPWAGAVEDALRARDAKTAIDRLAQRPGELLRRVDHVVRITVDDAFSHVLAAIQTAIPRGAPNTLLTLASHVRARTAPWPRRVMFPKGSVTRAWGMPDTRPPLRTDAIGSIVDGVRRELLARAEKRKQFARAVVDRGLVDLLVPIGERSASKSRVAWPRGSEAQLPAGETVRLFLHWEQPEHQRVDLDLSVAFYDRAWRQVAKCDFTHLVAGERAAVHSGDLTDAPAPLGASEFVDLDLAALASIDAAYAVMVVFSYNAVSFDKLTHGFAGVMVKPEGNTFDPRAVIQKFDLGGTSMITVPLTIDIEARRLRWLDVHLTERATDHQVGGYRAALAHVGRDFTDFVGNRARPTMWDLAALHAAARANVIYVRELDGTVSTIRRRDGETTMERLARIYDNPDHDSQLSRIPHADAPTLLVVLRDDLAIPKGSAGYILDARGSLTNLTRLAAGDLIAELAP